jgi:hypothetical protein
MRSIEKDGTNCFDCGEEISYLSIAEARRIMGENSKSMSDEDVEKAIYDLTYIDKEYIKTVPK